MDQSSGRICGLAGLAWIRVPPTLSSSTNCTERGHELERDRDLVFWVVGQGNRPVCVFDEIDLSLHPNAVRYLVALFTDMRTNPKQAQLVFTTNDVSLPALIAGEDARRSARHEGHFRRVQQPVRRGVAHPALVGPPCRDHERPARHRPRACRLARNPRRMSRDPGQAVSSANNARAARTVASSSPSITALTSAMCSDSNARPVTRTCRSMVRRIDGSSES